MDKPKKIKILSHQYDVEIVDKVYLGPTYYGNILYKQALIEIRDDLSYQQTKETLLHEVLHGIDDCMSIDLTEDQISGISQGLMSVFVDNPKFTNYLTSNDVKSYTDAARVMGLSNG